MFGEPRYLSVNKEGFLMVCDTNNDRIQVLELSEKFVTKIGSLGSKTGEFKYQISTENLNHD